MFFVMQLQCISINNLLLLKLKLYVVLNFLFELNFHCCIKNVANACKFIYVYVCRCVCFNTTKYHDKDL
jgi:hypothetical protein